MKPSLIEILTQDHKRIRSLVEELQGECNKSIVNEESCFDLFRTLKALVVAHAKAEEFTLYAVFENAKSRPQEDLQHFALEGYEEHDLMDFLMKEMGQAEEMTLQWRAQLTVLSELLDHHMKEEECDFFPKSAKVIDTEEMADMAMVYTRERDEIFAKKRGTRPALSMAHSAPH